MFSFQDLNKKIDERVDHFFEKNEHFLSEKIGDTVTSPAQPNTFFRSAKYLEKKAADKMTDLWTEIAADKSSGAFT